MATAVIDRARTDEKLINSVRNKFQTARAAKRPYLGMWRRNFELVNNRTWAPGRRSALPSPQSSEMFPILAAIVGWLTDFTPEWKPIPSADPTGAFYGAQLQLAHDMEAVLRSLWVLQDYAAEVEVAAFDGLMYGTGLLKVCWDPALSQTAGDVMMRRIDPWTFYPDPGATCLEDGSYFIEARRVSYDEIERRFGPDAVGRIRGGDSEYDTPPRLFDSVGREMMANAGGISGTGYRGHETIPSNPAPRYGLSNRGLANAPYEEGCVLYENWHRETTFLPDTTPSGDLLDQPVVDDHWRYIASAGNTVLMNETATDLWGHGRHPYCRFVFQETKDLWGVSLSDHLADHQISINRLLAAVQNNVELLGDPILMESSNSGLPRMQLAARAGQRLTKNVGSTVEWLTPPEIGQSAMKLVGDHREAMERTSGLTAITRGDMVGRPSEGTVDATQENSMVRIRLARRNLERCLRQAGELAANLISEFYTAPRLMAIVGPQGQQTAAALRARHFYRGTGPDDTPLRFDVLIRADSSMPISRRSLGNLAMQLYGLQAVDRLALLLALDFPGAYEIAQRMGAMEASGFPQGPTRRQASRPTAPMTS